jgi:murein DD-endopeptidase MepM/ murein hydrolase activator NlpD
MSQTSKERIGQIGKKMARNIFPTDTSEPSESENKGYYDDNTPDDKNNKDSVNILIKMLRFMNRVRKEEKEYSKIRRNELKTNTKLSEYRTNTLLDVFKTDNKKTKTPKTGGFSVLAAAGIVGVGLLASKDAFASIKVPDYGDLFTTGNDIYDKPDYSSLLDEKDIMRDFEKSLGTDPMSEFENELESQAEQESEKSVTEQVISKIFGSLLKTDEKEDPEKKSLVTKIMEGLGSLDEFLDLDSFNKQIKDIKLFYGPEDKTSTVGSGNTGKGKLTSNQKDFYDRIYSTLLEEATKAGVKNPEVIARLGAAQSSIETGYGKSTAGGNNFFGIKGSGDNQQTTQEWDPKTQKMVTQSASFRKYGSMRESAADYIEFLQTNSRYSGVLAASSVEEAITAQSKTGYATDPNYGKKLTWVQSAATSVGADSTEPIYKTLTSFTGQGNKRFEWLNSFGAPRGKKDPLTGERGYERLHKGIDIGSVEGSPIYARESGVVTFASPMGGYGNTIKIKHPDGTSSLYAHMKNFSVGVGSKVSLGDVIGQMGKTDRADGGSSGTMVAHLHLEYHDVNGKAIDPLEWNRMQSQKIAERYKSTATVEKTNPVTPEMTIDKNTQKTGSLKSQTTFVQNNIRNDTTNTYVSRNDVQNLPVSLQLSRQIG